MSLGWQVLAAARARETEGDARAMLEAAEAVRNSVALYVSLDTLEYLHKGRRIGGAALFVGSLLNVKPLVYVDHETGRVEAAGRVRPRKRGLNTLDQHFFQALGPGTGSQASGLHVAVMHGDAPGDAQQLMERIQREYAPAEILSDITSPVLGAHTGPRAIALCGYVEQ
jgi:DegV family protein with EDD domain